MYLPWEKKKCIHNQIKKEYCLRASGTTDNSKLMNRLRFYLYCRVKVFNANQHVDISDQGDQVICKSNHAAKSFKSIKIPLVLFCFFLLREKNYQKKTPTSLRLRSFIFVIIFSETNTAHEVLKQSFEKQTLSPVIFSLLVSFHSESLFDAPMCYFKSTLNFTEIRFQKQVLE